MDLRLAGLFRLTDHFAAAVSAASSLLDDLVSYWKLDEVSGTRADSVGDNDLTDNNTVGVSLAGPSGTVASFVAANTETLSVADGGAFNSLEGTGGFTIALWVSRTAGTPISKDDIGDSRQFVLLNDGDFYVFQNGSTYQTVATGLAADTAIHFYVVGWDPADGKVFAYKDNGAVIKSSGTLTGLNSGDVNLVLGNHAAGGYLNGTMAAVGIWAGVLGSGERTSLFNSGQGKKYADLTAAEKVGLVSYWNLDEVSGTRNDSHGTNHLTDNNSVGSVNSGPVGTVADFTIANSESLTKAGFTFTPNGGFTVAAWVRPTTDKGEYSAPIDHAYGASSGWMLGYYSNYRFLVSNGSGGAQAQGGTAYENDKWQFLVGWWDEGTGKIYVQNNLGAIGDADLASAVVGSGTLHLGRYVDGTYWDGNVATVGVWSRALTAPERTSLFNSGVGKKYADLTAAEKVGLVSYWDLSETSGTRVDSHGSNNLTDNNTVGSVINSGGAMHNAAASFVAASNENLSHDDTPTLRVGVADFTLALWYKIPGDPSPVDPFPIAKGGQGEYCIDLYQGVPRFYTKNGGAYPTATLGSPQAYGEWHFLVAWRDGTALKNYLQADNGTPVSGSMASVVDEDAAAGVFKLGLDMTGQVDEVAIWSRVLTSDERTALWNAGAGRYYPFTGSPV